MRKLRDFFDCLHNIGEWVVNIENCTTVCNLVIDRDKNASINLANYKSA